MNKYDYVVLGSGFGGGTVALRLCEAGKSVLILERGRRWRGKNLLPRTGDAQSTPFPEPGDSHYFWASKVFNPFRQRLGLYEMRQFTRLQGLVAAGVGGGSLIWANVVVQAHEEAFSKGWPAGINLDSLAQYYDMARPYLRPTKVPGVPTVQHEMRGQPNSRAQLHKLAAERLGLPWRPVDVAVTFGDQNKPAENGFGSARQLGCNWCGLCSAGCPQNAKNTVDLSYIAAAEALGAELRTLHEVRTIEAVKGGGYVLHANRYDLDGRLVERLAISAQNVIVSCGSFGTTELLLRSRDKGLLPDLSPALGTRFSVNGNVLSAALSPSTKSNAALDIGPAISSMIDLGTNAVEDIANPTFTAGMVSTNQYARIYHFLRAYLGFKTSPKKLEQLARDMLVYVGVGIDSASGRLRLNALGQLSLDWPKIASEPALEAQRRAQRQIAESLGREYVPDVFSTFRRQFTYHPLGGCPMADHPDNGVVDQYGQVYNYPGLYIADGSMVPSALGRNPSFTICALSERVVERMIS